MSARGMNWREPGATIVPSIPPRRRFGWRLRHWLARRRVLWAGFVRQVERYRAARAALEAPVVARAA